MTGRPIRITGGRCLIGTELVDRDLLVIDGRVVDEESLGGRVRAQVTEFDASGRIVAPGFVDLQINGGFGFDLASDPASMWDLGRQLPVSGVTSFLPTLITAPPERRGELLAALGDRPADFVGAEPLGAHLEGPCLNPDRRGAHDASLMVEPSAALIESWTPSNGVRLVTLAPELPGGFECIDVLAERGVAVFAGHTTADAGHASTAIEHGLVGVTHLFNAMAPIGHRAPNLAGVALTDDRLVASLIVDGVHVDPAVVDMAWRCLGPDRLVLVTDAVAAMGQPAGRFDFGDRGAESDGLAVRNDDGTLAGSALRMDQAVRNLVAFADCSVGEALACATAVPALVIGEADRGHLDVGARADIVVLDDELMVTDVFVGGQLASS